MKSNKLKQTIMALALGVAISATPLSQAEAWRTVFDPWNYRQNILTAVRSLKEINQQITQLRNEANLLLKMDLDLTKLTSTISPELSRTLSEIKTLMDSAEAIAMKVLYIGFFALLLNNFQVLADVVFNSFAGLGLKASGAPFGADQLMRPGFVADTGFSASWPLLEAAGKLIGFTSFFENFITIIEFKLTTLAGFVLVPFALFGKISFLAERVLGNIITSGIKLMVLAIVVGIGSTIFGGIATPPAGDIELKHAASIILAAIAVFGLAIFVPGLAAGLVSGAPQLGAGAAAGTAAGLIGAGVAGGAIASGSARAIGRAGGSAVTSAASLSGRVSAGYESGGLSDAAQATVGSAISSTASRMSAPVRDAHAHGAAEGYRATGGGEGAGFGRGAGALNSSSNSQPPQWAKQMHSRQRVREAGMITAHTLRDGDRGGSAEGPRLDPDK